MPMNTLRTALLALVVAAVVFGPRAWALFFG